MKVKFKSKCLNFGLNVFAQLPLEVPALFLVVYKPSKRKKVVEDIFNANKAVKNHPKKCPAHMSSIMKIHHHLWQLDAKGNLKLRVFMSSELVMTLVMKLSATFWNWSSSLMTNLSSLMKCILPFWIFCNLNFQDFAPKIFWWLEYAC